MHLALRLLDPLGKLLQLLLADRLGIHHADEQRLHGTVTKPFRNALHGSCRDYFTRLCRPIKKGFLIDGMHKVALLLKSSQHRSDGGILEWVSQLDSEIVGTDFGMLPDKFQDFSFEVSEFGRIVGSVTHRSVTNRNTTGSA